MKDLTQSLNDKQWRDKGANGRTGSSSKCRKTKCTAIITSSWNWGIVSLTPHHNLLSNKTLRPKANVERQEDKKRKGPFSLKFL